MEFFAPVESASLRKLDPTKPVSKSYYLTLFLRPIKLEKEMLYQDIIRSAGQKRGPTSYTMFILSKHLKFNFHSLFIAMASISYVPEQNSEPHSVTA